MISCFIFILRINLNHISLRWRHNERDVAENHQPHDCLLNRLFRRRSKKTSKLRVTGLYVVTGEFPTQRPVTQKCFHLMRSSWTEHSRWFWITSLFTIIIIIGTHIHIFFSSNPFFIFKWLPLIYMQHIFIPVNGMSINNVGIFNWTKRKCIWTWIRRTIYSNLYFVKRQLHFDIWFEPMLDITKRHHP